MRCVGICRFSYAGHGGFKVGHDSFDDLKSFLYAPARMEERFRLFEAITLPSVAQQTDPDFTFLIVTGNSLPQHYLDRLHTLTAGIPQCVIRQYPPRPHRRVMRNALYDWRGKTEEAHLQFRLDDDDAMALSFVEDFRQVAQDIAPIRARHPAVAVDFNRGFVYTADAEGVKLWPYAYAYSAIALGIVVQPGSDITIMSQGHQNLWKEMPTVTFTDRDMMMRGHNDFNDSRLTGKKNVFDYQPMTAGRAQNIRETFGVDDDFVREVFSRA